jgi:hypothetical protein
MCMSNRCGIGAHLRKSNCPVISFQLTGQLVVGHLDLKALL